MADEEPLLRDAGLHELVEEKNRRPQVVGARPRWLDHEVRGFGKLQGLPARRRQERRRSGARRPRSSASASSTLRYATTSQPGWSALALRALFHSITVACFASRSARRTRRTWAATAARARASVDFPTPPFCEMKDTTMGMMS